MQSRSADYLAIMANEAHTVEWRVTINGTVYGAEDKLVYAAGGGGRSPRLIRQMFSGAQPEVGRACATQFSCAVMEASSAIPRMATVIPAYRLTAGSSVSEWITLGTFYIDTRQTDKATGALMLSCYDRMLVADGAGGKTYADLTGFDEWPQTMSAVVNEIAAIMGISIDARTTIRSGTGYNVEYPNDLTMREVLQQIAAAHAGNWCITPMNALRLVPLTGSLDSLTLGTDTVGLKTSPALESWAGVIVYYADEEAFEAGDTTGETGRVLTCDCLWATQETANGILSILRGSAYQPYTAAGAIIDLALELGDSVTVGTTGQTVTGPVWSIDLAAGLIEQADIAAPGEDEIDHEYPYLSYTDRSLRRKVALGQAYYGVTISRKNGLKIKRTDGASEALFNSDRFEMDALIDGVMTPRIWFDSELGDYRFAGRLTADAMFTDSLYAEQGDIAELTVDQLSTSRRIRKFILGDTSDDNFVLIKDQYQRFITGTIKSASTLDTEDSGPLLTESGVSLTLEVGQAATEQAKNRFGQNLYWQKEPVSHTSDGYPLDANGVQIYATTNVTTWPVTVYQYTELVKAQEAFERGGTRNNYLPQIIMGAGDENGNSKGYIYKDEQGFYLRYKSKLAKNVDIVFGDDGFVDAMHRRLSSLEYNTDTGVVLYTVEGSDDLLSMRIREQNGVMTATWPDGHTCTIQVSGPEGNI